MKSKPITPDDDGVRYALVESLRGVWWVKAWTIASRNVGVSIERVLPVDDATLTLARSEAKKSLFEPE